MSDYNALKKEFLSKYLSIGEKKFYRFLLTYACQKIILMRKDELVGLSPDIEFMECYEKFLILYRREGDDKLLEISRLFRKAAHRVYRIMLKKNMTHKNVRFLNLVNYDGN